MARPVDPVIPGDEKLFRSISLEHLSPVGDILSTAVDVPRCSFNRARYAPEPNAVLSPSRPEENGVVVMLAGDLPEPVPRPPRPPQPGLVPLVFYVVDDPTDENDAHAEVRVRPSDQLGSPNYKVKDKVIREKAKEALARKLSVLIAPVAFSRE